MEREARPAGSSCRIDLLLKGEKARRDCWVEVKSVTLVEQGTAYFPDAPSRRASRHLQALTALARSGARAVLLFCVQRDDAAAVRPAERIDPLYAAAARKAAGEGVEMLAYGARVDPLEIILREPLAVGGVDAVKGSETGRANPDS